MAALFASIVLFVSLFLCLFVCSFVDLARLFVFLLDFVLFCFALLCCVLFDKVMPAVFNE